MPLLAIGINHRTAPITIRERVAFPQSQMSKALCDLVAQPLVSEAAILSTCNRTELYCGTEQSNGKNLIEWLGKYHNLTPKSIEPYSYTHPDQATVRHMLRVASGLDSMVLGEPQILGQLKAAYQAAQQAGTLGRLLRPLFQHSFFVAKQVRTDTEIGASPVSVAFAAVSLAKQIFGQLKKQTALLIGAGETIELAARHLHQHGLGKMIIANRSLQRARTLGVNFEAYTIGLEEIPAHLAEADIVLSSTGAPNTILHKKEVVQAMEKRRHRPIFMVDMAVPRDIDPQINSLEDVYLYTVDDLQEVIQENIQSRRQAAHQAEEIVDIQVDHFMSWMRSQCYLNTLTEYREKAYEHRHKSLQMALRRLRAGQHPEKVLANLAHTLTNKLLHIPSVKLREAGRNGRQDLLQAANELFELTTDSQCEDLDSK